jgi:erythromycin esterase-like protein
MLEMTHERTKSTLLQEAQVLMGATEQYDALIDMIGNARLVLLGEASHGTHEFYRERAQITKRLIEEKNFHAVAVEADWPDAYRVNRYVRGESDDATSAEALTDFERFPQWMWRNTAVVDFVGWLRAYNDLIARPEERIGFYGLDLYSLYGSIQQVLGYLDKTDTEAARRARQRYSCLEHFGADPQTYGYAASLNLDASCEQEVIKQLTELRRNAGAYLSRDGRVAEDELFFAEQNARVVQNAEEYYRSMFRGDILSWNLRDRHMAQTLDTLLAHLSQRVGRAKIVVWEHNSHLGDARATEIGAHGEFNVGQLVRETYGGDAVLCGFTTYQGTVTAASDWDAPAERKRVLPALANSYENLFHQQDAPRIFFNLRDTPALARELRRTRLERAIGVIYRPDTERISHYFDASLPEQFDAVLHFDETRAVEPLERSAHWQEPEPPETYPTGI